jgi:hypothetical protein
MSVTSRHAMRFKLRKQVVFPEEGDFSRGGAKRSDIADFLRGRKKPTPFKFPVPRQTVDGVTRRILQTRFYPHGRPGVRRQAAPTAAHLGLEQPVQTSGNFLCEINGIKSGHDNENF